MSLPLVFHPDVRGEIDDAYRWYEQQRAGLGDDFLAALEEVFRRIERIPTIHQLVWQDIRRALPDASRTGSSTASIRTGSRSSRCNTADATRPVGRGGRRRRGIRAASRV
jgi:hypothetical protein